MLTSKPHRDWGEIALCSFSENDLNRIIDQFSGFSNTNKDTENSSLLILKEEILSMKNEKLNAAEKINSFDLRLHNIETLLFKIIDQIEHKSK